MAGFILLGCEHADDGFRSAVSGPPHYSEDPPWVVGFNVPWNDFGRDFGPIDNEAFWKKALTEAQEMGFNLARIWIHCDGRANPLWDLDRDVPTGLPDGFEADFQLMLDLAAERGIGIMPCLWSFDLVEDRTEEHGPAAGVHTRFVESPERIEVYLQEILRPLVERFDAHPALYAWEIINEPEWMVENHGVSKADVQRFVGLHAAALQQWAQKPVTCGSASLKFNAMPPYGVDNWWSDEALRGVTGDTDATLDFYQIHAYGWMMPDGYYPYDKSCRRLGLDKPVMIGEAPARGMRPPEDSGLQPISMEAMTIAAYDLGYFGHLVWSFSGHDGVGGRADADRAMKVVAKRRPEILANAIEPER